MNNSMRQDFRRRTIQISSLFSNEQLFSLGGQQFVVTSPSMIEEKGNRFRITI